MSEVNFQERVILHIGGAKVGSSAIQRMLTVSPVLRRPDGIRLCYWTVDHSHDGPVFRRVSADSPVDPILGYRASNAAIPNLPGACLHQKFTALVALLEPDEVAILSSEAWAQQMAWSDGRRCTCDAPAFSLRAILFVRPQVPYFQSSYLQWGLWESASAPDWVDEMQRLADWAQACEGTRHLGCDALTVCWQPDVAAALFAALGAEPPPGSYDPRAFRVNQSLGQDELAFLMRNRSLRPTAAGPAAAFVIEARRQQWNLPRSTPVHLTTRDLATAIVDRFTHSNRRLLEFCDPDTRRRIEEAGEWWKRDWPELPEVPTPIGAAPSPEMLEALAVGAIADLIALERRLPELEATIARLTQLTTAPPPPKVGLIRRTVRALRAARAQFRAR